MLSSNKRRSSQLVHGAQAAKSRSKSTEHKVLAGSHIFYQVSSYVVEWECYLTYIDKVSELCLTSIQCHERWDRCRHRIGLGFVTSAQVDLVANCSLHQDG